VLAQWFGDLHLIPSQNADELQGVNDGLALEVIVGNDKNIAGVFLHGVDAGDPRIEFFARVEVVVALVRGSCGIVAEPGVVAATMKADVSNCRGALGGRLEGMADDGLINVAETRAKLAQEGQSFIRLPGRVAQFDNQRVIGEAHKRGGQVRDRFARAMERKRELQKDGAEFLRITKDIKAGADSAFVLGRGGEIMGEPLPELGGKQKCRVGRDAIHPGCGVVGAKWLVKRSVNFDGVEESSEVCGLVKALGTVSWIDVARPIGVGPARGTDANLSLELRIGRGGVLHRGIHATGKRSGG